MRNEPRSTTSIPGSAAMQPISCPVLPLRLELANCAIASNLADPESMPGFVQGYSRLIDQILGQEIEQHAVMKTAVGSSFVSPHDPDSLEADLLVRADGVNVVGGGVDGDAVMPSLVEEEAAHQAYRLGSEALALVLRGEEEIDSRVPVVAMQLLPSRNPAYRSGVHRDDEGGDALCPIGIIPGEKFVPVEVLIGLAPMAGDPRLTENLQEARKIVLDHGMKDDARTLKNEARHLTLSVQQVICDFRGGNLPLSLRHSPLSCPSVDGYHRPALAVFVRDLDQERVLTLNYTCPMRGISLILK